LHGRLEDVAAGRANDLQQPAGRPLAALRELVPEVAPPLPELSPEPQRALGDNIAVVKSGGEDRPRLGNHVAQRCETSRDRAIYEGARHDEKPFALPFWKVCLGSEMKWLEPLVNSSHSIRFPLPGVP
jgi:hypothetical protein